MDREAWHAAIHGVAKSRTRLKRLSSNSREINLRKLVSTFTLFVFSLYNTKDIIGAHKAPSLWNSPGRNTGVVSRSLLQSIFLTQGLNPVLLNCRQILYHLSHQGSPSPPFSSVQFSSVTQSCLTLCDPMNHRTPGLPVHHQLPEFTETHVHRVSDAIQPSHPLLSLSPPAPDPFQHQGLLQ